MGFFVDLRFLRFRAEGLIGIGANDKEIGFALAQNLSYFYLKVSKKINTKNKGRRKRN